MRLDDFARPRAVVRHAEEFDRHAYVGQPLAADVRRDHEGIADEHRTRDDQLGDTNVQRLRRIADAHDVDRDLTGTGELADDVDRLALIERAVGQNNDAGDRGRPGRLDRFTNSAANVRHRAGRFDRFERGRGPLRLRRCRVRLGVAGREHQAGPDERFDVSRERVE